MCYCDSYDQPKVYNQFIRTARKEHQCCECRGKIAKGEKYEHVTGLWDDRWDEYKTCSMCKALWNLFDCRMFQGLSECLHEEQYEFANKFVLFDSNEEACMKEQYNEDKNEQQSLPLQS